MVELDYWSSTVGIFEFERRFLMSMYLFGDLLWFDEAFHVDKLAVLT